MFTTPALPQQSQELQVPHENEARAQRRCDSCDTRFRSEGPIRVAHTIAAGCDTGMANWTRTMQGRECIQTFIIVCRLPPDDSCKGLKYTHCMGLGQADETGLSRQANGPATLPLKTLRCLARRAGAACPLRAPHTGRD